MADSLLDNTTPELIASRVGRARARVEMAVVEYIGWLGPHTAARETSSGSGRPMAQFHAVPDSGTSR